MGPHHRSRVVSETELAAERDLGTPFDLQACAQEPIHRLGMIQSYGCLVAARAGVIEVASANTGPLLGVDAADLIGEPLELLFDTTDPTHGEATGPMTVRAVVVRPKTSPDRFAVTTHASDGMDVLEFEPAIDGPPALSVAAISRTLHRLQDSTSVAETCRSAVHEIQTLTGYERVVVYRFADPDGPGEVIAEALTTDQDPWLGLWFPASDIPPQARELYRRNWIRVIADVDDPGATLISPSRPADGLPLDLSWSVLRAVSGYHIEYLRNIEVRSSMSVSLLAGDDLWGLIACHGRRPRRLSPEQRSACELFGTALSLRLSALRQRDERAAAERARAALNRTITDLAGAPFPPDDLASLARLVEADTLVVSSGHLTRHTGRHPGDAAVTALRLAMPALEPGQVWHHDNLAALDARLDVWSSALSGALVLQFGTTDDVVMWLRGEQRREQRWAVDPDRPVRAGPNGQRLTPRGSSAVHARTVRGHSRPWTGPDITTATELGRMLAHIVLAHAAELTTANTRLERANRDLEFFVHAAAHDLKEPLRGMRRTVEAIVDDAQRSPAGQSGSRVATLQRLNRRMTDLINALLRYAMAGQQSLDRQPVDLRLLADRAVEVAGPRLHDHGLEVRLPPPGRHRLWVDPSVFEEILVNLMVNAAKYARADEPHRWVAIGVSAATPPGQHHDMPAVYVQDNGIGIPAEQRSRAFDLFTRLHRPGSDPEDGAGVGLAIVRRLVEAHDGTIWLQDDPGAATSIRIAVPEP